MSNLLVVQRLQSRAMQRKGTMPLILEFGVVAETAPYLVSSSASVMWVNEPLPENMVRAAVRDSSVAEFYTEVVEAVAAMGSEMMWGNVHPLTPAGLQAAVEHVEFYELGPVELLCPRAHPKGSSPPPPDDEDDGGGSEGKPKRVEPVDLMPPELRPLIEGTGLPFRTCSWVPDGTIVVVPKDRAYVGVVSKVTPKKIAGVVHNAARGIAIARGLSQDELAASPPAHPVAD